MTWDLAAKKPFVMMIEGSHVFEDPSPVGFVWIFKESEP